MEQLRGTIETLSDMFFRFNEIVKLLKYISENNVMGYFLCKSLNLPSKICEWLFRGKRDFVKLGILSYEYGASDSG